MKATYSPPPITSRNHTAVKPLRALHVRAERDRRGLFLVEGVRFVAEAVAARAVIDTLVVASPMLPSRFARELVHQLRRKVRTLDVTPEVFQSLALTDDPQGVAAIVRQKWAPLERLDPSEGLCWVAVSTIHSAGNLGTMIRTCDAVGAAGVILLDRESDPYDPATVRATMGAIFAPRFARITAGELAAWKRHKGVEVVGTSPHAECDYHTTRYADRAVLLMGGERKGLPEEHLALCDRLVRIPMVGRSDSLNLAVAASVMLYELFNQRRCRRETA